MSSPTASPGYECDVDKHFSATGLRLLAAQLGRPRNVVFAMLRGVIAHPSGEVSLGPDLEAEAKDIVLRNIIEGWAFDKQYHEKVEGWWTEYLNMVGSGVAARGKVMHLLEDRKGDRSGKPFHKQNKTGDSDQTSNGNAKASIPSKADDEHIETLKAILGKKDKLLEDQYKIINRQYELLDHKSKELQEIKKTLKQTEERLSSNDARLRDTDAHLGNTMRAFEKMAIRSKSTKADEDRCKEYKPEPDQSEIYQAGVDQSGSPGQSEEGKAEKQALVGQASDGSLKSNAPGHTTSEKTEIASNDGDSQSSSSGWVHLDAEDE